MCKQKSLLEIQDKGQKHFCSNMLMGHHKEKKKNYSIIELRNGIHPRQMIYIWNQSTHPTACLLIDTWHQTNHCITGCSKWISDSNF